MNTIKMAYAIQCHKNAQQINRLIASLDDNNVDLFLHIDKKAQFIKEITHQPNICLINNRIDVQWGGFSQVEATLEMFNIIRSTQNHYAYIHLVSGQDFPIKSREYINGFFHNNLGAQFIQFNIYPLHLLNRIKVYYPKCLFGRGEMRRIIRSVFKLAIMKSYFLRRKTQQLPKLYNGSGWFSLTGDCIEYILDFVDKNKDFYRFFHNAMCSDETFFQTIILNSEYKDKVVNNNLRYIDWCAAGLGSPKTSGWFKRGSTSPRTLLLEDYERLSNSKCLFARKFDLDTDANIIQRIERSLLKLNMPVIDHAV